MTTGRISAVRKSVETKILSDLMSVSSPFKKRGGRLV